MKTVVSILMEFYLVRFYVYSKVFADFVSWGVIWKKKTEEGRKAAIDKGKDQSDHAKNHCKGEEAG